MMAVMSFDVRSEGRRAWTEGLGALGRHEVLAEVDEPSLVEEAEALVRFVGSYVTGQDATIRAGETMAYGYWLVKFEPGPDDRLHVWEYDATATRFVPGATLTLRYWREQHEVCERYGAAYSPPRPDRLVALSDGVLEGDPVQGVRYPSPEHMSGWWVTTDRYDGNVSSLRNEHLYHLTARRPELSRYIALPEGFRFDLAHGEDVWFDEKVLRS